MTGANSLELNQIVDGQRLRGASIVFIVLAALAMASDGYDLASLGYIIPELLKQWHLGRTALAPAAGAGIIGMAIGGPLLGMLGDRFGRKPMIVAGLATIAVLDLLMTQVRGPGDLVILRGLVGLMVGGVFPNAAALIAEITPRLIRGRVLVLVSLGVVLGIAIPGFVARGLVPTHGWQSILVVGACAQLVVAAAVALIMPESIKYLAARTGRELQALRMARRLRPDLTIADNARLVAGAAAPAKGGSIRLLFAGSLAVVTPMLWICQAANQMSNFFSLTWLPQLLQAGGASTAAAGGTASLFAIGGLIAGVLLLFVIERLGVMPMVAMFFVGAPLVASMASTSLSPTIHALVIVSAGFCVQGIQIGLTAALGLLYPTTIRSVGTGWTQAAGRLGAFAAPTVGALLLGLNVSTSKLPFAPGALLLVGGVACVVLTLACRRQFGSFRVAEFPIASGAGKVPLDPVAGTA
ncbi:MFS transporter [Sphingomonas bacterium]|uniref:MFS transporter n=1 Tax=Sphingomonas bacterium TaxID=1895847 RepID=UPI001576B932|nr:MFS transporter [Sphingomonas bacterium]